MWTDVKSLHGMAPVYLAELCQYVSADDAWGGLRSAELGDLITPEIDDNVRPPCNRLRSCGVEQSVDVSSERQFAF